MNWTPLTPSRPGESLASILKSTSLTSSSGQPIKLPPPTLGAWLGPLPESLHLIIISYVPVPDLTQLARVSRGFGRLVASDEAWERRWKSLGIEDDLSSKEGMGREDGALGGGLDTSIPQTSTSSSHKPTSSASRSGFGDFSAPSDDFGDFVDVPIPPPSSSTTTVPNNNLFNFDDVPLPSRYGTSAVPGGRKQGFFAFDTSSSSNPASSHPPTVSKPLKPKPPYRALYRKHHESLIPLILPLLTSPAPSPSQTLSILFPPSQLAPISPSEQSQTLTTIFKFLSSRVQPITPWLQTRQLMLAAADRFDAACLVAFEGADSKEDEAGMKEWAEAGWRVWWEANGARRSVEDWEVGRVWIERKEIFYEGSAVWDPLRNILTPPATPVPQLDFTPMDSFVSHVISILLSSGHLATRVFPPAAQVLRMFAERVISEVIGEAYVAPLLSRAREVGSGQGGAAGMGLFLRASAAVFAMTGRVVDAIVEAGVREEEAKSVITKAEVESFVFKMFEFNMDEYLDEEIDWVKDSMDQICKEWDAQLKNDSSKPHHTSNSANAQATFLASQNPAQVKRNVLAGFRDVLLLPVTIIPKTAVYVVSAGSTAAVSGLSMLNPQNWQGGNSAAIAKAAGTTDKMTGLPNGYGKSDEINAAVFELGDDDEEHRGELNEKLALPISTTLPIPSSTKLASSQAATPKRNSTPVPPPSSAKAETFESLQLLISLDTALSLIHADRDALKRVETFQAYPGRTGARVKETIEEVFIMLLQAMSDRHIGPGFRIATEQMRKYKPAEHEEARSVAPLLQFFELVHVGDTIQSMVQVYFDKEMAPHIDRTDFLNGVVREKKRFENVLDEAVAAGLNAGIEVLMNQVEHIIITRTGPREYYPIEGAEMDLGPTRGCREAVKSLEMHCDLLKGSTSKDVLEVFYQEVGIRLQSILQRHLKRQIISLTGGFQIISDLNTYHAFIASLKQQRVTDDFSNLKMLGHVYIVEDAKDLAQIVRDVTRYGGTFRPEDIYEFIQRRSDWKRIEKTVDNAMYSLSLKEDCVIM